ncbi:MAG TPA: ThiF family adenylyltransferase [Lacisediminihabitans sp.]|uniref:ThiF family adenylyltransferase n=1 Tax=Lacisediminihabitans sp. TaxID=2787631 RepID=UPI002ED89533
MGQNERERYARQERLPGFGAAAQARLGAARVLVIGAGGLGSSIIPALAAAGVGTIGIVDDDTVELSNLHRQHIHGMADLGRSKVRSASETVAALNPDTRVMTIEDRLDATNALDLFADYDLVIDGSDNFPTRYLANDAAALSGIPLVWGAVSQYAGQAGLAWADRGPQYRDLFPAPPPPGTVPSCEEGGVLPTVCAVIGSIMATEAIKVLTGIGAPLIGAVTTFDALSGAFRRIDYGRDPAAEPITGLVDYELFCGLPSKNPADGAGAEELTAEELAAELAGGAPMRLLDVREPWEAEIAALPGAVLIPLGELGARVDELAGGDPIVVYCHHGIRSARALDLLRSAGIPARHLGGGIDAWSRRIDPAMARY